MCGCGLQVFDLREAKIEVNAGTDSRQSCLRSRGQLPKGQGDKQKRTSWCFPRKLWPSMRNSWRRWPRRMVCLRRNFLKLWESSPKSRRSCCGKCSKLPGKPVTWTRNTKKRRVELAVLQKIPCCSQLDHGWGQMQQKLQRCNAEDWPPQKPWGGEALDKQKEMGRGVGTGGDEVQTGCRNFEMEEESRRPPILLAQVQRSPQTRQVEDQMSQISAGDGQKQLKEQNWPSSWLQWKQLRTALGQMHKRKDLVKKVQASQKAGRPAGLKGLKSKKQMTVKAVKD